MNVSDRFDKNSAGSNGMRNTVNPDIHIPEKAPRIGIQTIDPSPADICVELKGDPFHFGAFDPGDEFMVCDYDFPDEMLTQVSRGLTRGPIMFQGYPCTEIVTHENDAKGNPLQQVRRLVSPGTRFARILLICLRRPGGMGSAEITNLEFPMFVEPGIRWQVLRAAGDHPSGQVETNTDRITGLIDLFVGKQSFRCLRWLRPRTTAVGRRVAEEIFIDIESALTVLVRGFVGSDYPNIEQFQRSPQLEIAGGIYYLQYVRRVIRS